MADIQKIINDVRYYADEIDRYLVDVRWYLEKLNKRIDRLEDMLKEEDEEVV